MEPQTAFPGLIYKAAHNPRITCLTCGDLMPVIETEYVSISFEIRSYCCKRCKVTEQFVIEL
jgi:hypothetical protein